MAMRSSITFLAIALFASGCAHYPVNAPLAAVDGRTGYRFENTAFSTNSDDLLLMLAFSGGGTRAAALDYGVLEQLARTGGRGVCERFTTESRITKDAPDRGHYR